MSITEAVRIDTAADMRALRERQDFHEGAMAVLSYPTAEPVAFFSFDNPKIFGTGPVRVGDTIARDAAGNFFLNPEVAA